MVASGRTKPRSSLDQGSTSAASQAAIETGIYYRCRSSAVAGRRHPTELNSGTTDARTSCMPCACVRECVRARLRAMQFMHVCVSVPVRAPVGPCVCEHICMHACVCACVRARRAHARTRAHAVRFMHVCVHPSPCGTCMCMRVRAYVRAYVRERSYAYRCMHACVHARAHTFGVRVCAWLCVRARRRMSV